MNGKRLTVWSETMDEHLLRATLFQEPYKYTARTKMSGKSWILIATALSENQHFPGQVDARACRERYTQRASGISPDDLKNNKIMDEIIERMAEFESLTN